MEQGIFHRSELLFGKEKMAKLAEKKIILFGIGGVGSWCAESLIRSGIKKLTIVDSDRVCVTNINRQLMATISTVGEVKTEALKRRLVDINPNADITPIQKIYNQENYQEFDLESFDIIIDAIDSLSNKVHLLKTAIDLDIDLYSSMGAALRIDPTRIKVASLWDVKGCHFARVIRKMMRRQGVNQKDIQCVYSDEILPNIETSLSCDTENCLSPKSKSEEGVPELANHDWNSSKAQINGSLAHMTAIYGFTLAGLVLKSVYEN